MVQRRLDTGWRIALACLAWLGGLALQLQQSALWPESVHAGALAVGAAGMALGWALRLLARRRSARALSTASLLVICASLALLSAASTDGRARSRLAETLDPRLEGQDLELTGVVASLPHVGPSGTRFVLEVESARQGARMLSVPTEVPAVVALGWYANDRDDELPEDLRATLRAGERWRLPVRLKLPHGTMNPDGFDVELWWWEQGIRATGSVRSGLVEDVASRLDPRAGHPVERARQAVRDAIVQRIADARLAGVIAALVVGDQAAIERQDWDLFRNTGVAHLMSISGLHVTMFAWAAGGLVGWVWRRSRRAMLWKPAPLASRWGGLAVATAYALLAGWGVPAERTLLMLACGVVLRSLGARWPWMLVLLLAAVLVTLFDPWALLQAGFWLSFAAVGLLMASEPATSPDDPEALRPSAWRRAVHGHLRSQLIATLGLAPLSLLFFQQLSVVGFAANLVAIPMVTLVITPLALMGVVAAPLWVLASWCIQALVIGLGWLAALPMAVWSVPTAPAWAQGAGLLGALIGVLPMPWRLRSASFLLLLPLLLPPTPAPPSGRFDAVVADVGQGTAVLVRTREHMLVYDAGPMYSRESDAGQRVLVPLLRSRGIRRIDLLMLSHRDTDHVGGTASLRSALPVMRVSSSLAEGHALLQGVSHLRCEDGQSWTWDGVRFDVLHPTVEGHATARTSNAVSCVLKVSDAQGRSLLLTGDIEAPQEAALLQRHPEALASTWLLVPHHGSRTSSTAAFLDAVRPELALVQAGYRSRHGHPAPDVVSRYEDRHIALIRTDRCGAWLWHDGAASCTREVHRRYWHWNRPFGGVEAGANVANPTSSGENQR